MQVDTQLEIPRQLDITQVPPATHRSAVKLSWITNTAVHAGLNTSKLATKPTFLSSIDNPTHFRQMKSALSLARQLNFTWL